MVLPENDYQILKLTDAFYNAYPKQLYPEILEKRKRAYNCILFQTHYDYYICVPYRTEITHKYAYHFKKSLRSKMYRSGLDYTKIIIIQDGTYIDTKDALLDKDEYNETMINIEKIKRESLIFVEDYVMHIQGVKLLQPQEFVRRYNYSTLQYFHKELGI